MCSGYEWIKCINSYIHNIISTNYWKFNICQGCLHCNYLSFKVAAWNLQENFLFVSHCFSHQRNLFVWVFIFIPEQLKVQPMVLIITGNLKE